MGKLLLSLLMVSTLVAADYKAEPSGPIGKTPLLVIREAVAWWAYRLGLA